MCGRESKIHSSWCRGGLVVAALAAWPAKTPRKLVSAAAGDGPGHANSRAPSLMVQTTMSAGSIERAWEPGAFGKGSLADPPHLALLCSRNLCFYSSSSSLELCRGRTSRATIGNPRKLSSRRLNTPTIALIPTYRPSTPTSKIQQTIHPKISETKYIQKRK